MFPACPGDSSSPDASLTPVARVAMTKLGQASSDDAMAPSPHLHLRTGSVPSEGVDSEAQYLSMSHAPRNHTLAREADGCRHVLFHCSIFIVVDICRQVAGYGMKYYNDDQFPVEPTEIVAISEFLKVRAPHSRSRCGAAAVATVAFLQAYPQTCQVRMGQTG